VAAISVGIVTVMRSTLDMGATSNWLT